MYKVFLKIIAVITPILLVFFYIFVYLKPSNSKNWVAGMKNQASIKFDKNTVVVSNFRQWRYDNKKPISFTYSTKEFDTNSITKVYFLIEPFDKFEGIAHTYFLFEFENGDNAAISVEARREQGEHFSAFLGLFKKYELIYIWGDDEDITTRRIKVENNNVYKYPLKLTKMQAKSLFTELANDTKLLETKPKFYNTLTDNCTNVLAKAANRAFPNSIPWDISWVLPGLSDNFLFKLGLIDTKDTKLNKEKYLIK